MRPQMPLQGLELLSILKADDVLRRQRLLDRHGGLQLFLRSLDQVGRSPIKRGMHIGDERR